MNNQIELIDIEQNTTEWSKFRRNHIGASDAPVILKQSPWKTPYYLWQEKLGLKDGPEENEAMKRGKEKEEQARKGFIKQIGRWHAPHVIKNSSYPFMCASMDGACIYSPGKNQPWVVKSAVEIKVPGRLDHECAMDGVIPEKYIPQLMHQMIVCNLESIFYFSWNETSSKILEFARDCDLEIKLLVEEENFWKCVQNLEEPDLTEKDYKMRTDQEFMQAAEEWKKANEMRKNAQEKEDNCRKKLIELAQNDCCRTETLRLTKYMRKGSIPYTEIPLIKEMNLESYRKPPSLLWRIS
jgi:putative phage-type endonuclease